MFGKKSVDALVIGAGPSGMMAALSLARRDIDTAIIDTASRCCTRSNALVLHPTTLKRLNQFGIVEQIIETGYLIDKLCIYDDFQLRETVLLNQSPDAFPFAVAIPQSELELILEAKLIELGISPLWKYRATEARAHDRGIVVDVDRYADQCTGYAISRIESVVYKTLHFDTEFVIAVDGYNSLMKRIAKVETTPLAPNQYFAFLEFETDMDPQHTIRLSLKDKLATAQYPINEGCSRIAFQYLGLEAPSENRNKDRGFFQEELESPEALADEQLKELIDQRVPWNIGYINRVTHRAIAPFEKRYLKEPRKGRIFFLGDAARTFGPLGMTSMNLGIQEAEQLAVAFKRIQNEGLPMNHLDAVGDHMVSRWEALANLENLSIPDNLTDPWVKDNRVRILRALPATGETLERLAEQLSIHLRLGNLVAP